MSTQMNHEPTLVQKIEHFANECDNKLKHFQLMLSNIIQTLIKLHDLSNEISDPNMDYIARAHFSENDLWVTLEDFLYVKTHEPLERPDPTISKLKLTHTFQKFNITSQLVDADDIRNATEQYIATEKEFYCTRDGIFELHNVINESLIKLRELSNEIIYTHDFCKKVESYELELQNIIKDYLNLLH